MTQPDGAIPSGATQPGDFAGLAALTQADVTSALKAGVLDSFTDAQNIAHDAYNEPIAELQDIAAAERVTPLWVGAGNQDLASFPRAMLQPTATPGPVGSVWDLNNFRVEAKFPQYLPGNGVADFAPIIVDRKIKINDFKFITGTDTLWTGTTEHYLALYGYNPTTSTLLKLWGSSNIVSAGALAATREYPFDMGFNDTQETVPGQILFAAQLQKVGVGSARNIAAIHQCGITPSSGGAVKAMAYYITGQTGLASSYPLSSLTLNNALSIWMAVAP